MAAHAATPALTQALPARTFAAGSAASVSIDLREHFGLPGVSGQVVQFETDLGKFNVELHGNAAPVTVANFLNYVTAGSYTNSIFHRSVPGFVLQGGGFGVNATPQLYAIPTSAPITLESSLPNVRGTIAMARTTAPNSATSQWFFNTVDNSQVLQPGSSGGYAVFGRVIGTGMSVVDAMAALPWVNLGSPLNELPVKNWSGEPIDFHHLVMLKRTDVIPIHPTATSVRSVLSFAVQNSNSAVLTATLSGSDLQLAASGAAGSTTVTITATDTNGNTASGSFTVSVNKLTQAITFAPLADRGFSAAPIALSAAADSGLPISFSVVEGPATISGAALSVLAPGTITVRATQLGNDTYAAATAVERTFVVSPNFAFWQVENFSAEERANPAISGPHAILAGDGLSNLVKYALGLNPRVPVTSGLPGVTFAGGEWTFHYARPLDRGDITYRVEYSTNLSTWTSSGVTHESVGTVDDFAQWRGRVPFAAGTVVFFRLKVTQP